MARYIGKEMSRVDGVAKVTGKAKYAAEFQVPNIAYGFLVTSSIGKGTINSIDTTEASRAPGVIRIFTHENYPKLEAKCVLRTRSCDQRRADLESFSRAAIKQDRFQHAADRSGRWLKHSSRRVMPHVSSRQPTTKKSR